MTQTHATEGALLSTIQELTPVAQLYVLDDGIDTLFTVNNFYSVLVPEIRDEVLGQFLFFNEHGQFLTREQFTLPYNGSFSVSVRATLEKSGFQVSLGSACCIVYPEDLAKFEPYIGQSFAHFFAYYRTAAEESLAMVHPQARFGDNAHASNFKDTNWRSSQSIVSRDLDKLCLLQLNPTVNPADLTYELRDFRSKEAIASKRIEIPPLGVAKTVFSAGEMACPSGMLYLTVTPLLCKPLIMRCFPDRSFGMSHS